MRALVGYVREVSGYLLCGVCVVAWLAHALRVRTIFGNSLVGVLQGLGSFVSPPSPYGQEKKSLIWVMRPALPCANMANIRVYPSGKAGKEVGLCSRGYPRFKVQPSR